MYYVAKRCYSEKAGLVPGQQPWVWRPLPPPYGKLENLPTSKIAFRALVRRLLQKFGPGRFKIMRSQFGGEKPAWKPVIYFMVRSDAKFKIVKRYTEFKSHEGDTQAYWKKHRRRVLVVTDVKERLRQRRRQLLDKMKPKVERPKRPKLRIEGRTWKYETR